MVHSGMWRSLCSLLDKEEPTSGNDVIWKFMNRKIVLAVCTVLFMLFSVPFVAAQEDETIDILNNEVSVLFPEVITFRLNAISTVDIERIFLIYGTEGLTCQDGGARQIVDGIHPQVLTVAWEWELMRSGALPPGVTVWWEWELRTTDGDIITLEREQITIEDSGPDWRTVQNESVIVHWYRGNVAFGNEMLNVADESLSRIAADLGVDAPADVEMWVYPSSQAVRDAILNVPEWTGGVAFPEYGIVVMGVDEGELDWARQIVPHELAHLVVGGRIFNCRGVSLPTWLNEGLARYAEETISELALNEIDAALAAERVPTLRSLSNGFSAYSNAASLAYTQSYLVVDYLIETFGAEQMDSLLTLVRDGRFVDDALIEVYGFDTDGLDVAWRTASGFAPTPTPEVDGLALQATLTPIPTLALGGVPVAQPTETPEPSVTPTATAEPTETMEPTAIPSATPTAEATQIAAVNTETDSRAAEGEPAAVTQPAEAQQPWLLWGSIAALLLIVPLIYLLLKRS